MLRPGLIITATCGALLLASGSADAIDRDCPRGQYWNPNKGACVKKKTSNPAKKYYQALEHLEGTARRPRPERGVKLLGEACKSKHAQSCTMLGFLYLNARAVEFNAVTSLAYYEKACTLKDPDGCLGAADLHSRGLLGPIDHGKALPLLDAACKLGSGKGCYQQAEKYDSALGVARDWRKARDLYTTAFKLLDAACTAAAGPECHLVGLSRFHGRGTTSDRARALAAFHRGCAAGDGNSCYWLGVSYRYAYGTTEDANKALEYFLRACKQYDNADACHDGGAVIAQRAPVTARTSAENQSLHQLGKRACDLDKRTCDLLGYLHATGASGQQNQTLASKWYVVGCEHGSSAACQSAAHRAFDGNGMDKDVDRALKMWQQACDLNWAEACADLGEHYYEGKVTEKDLARAYKLFNLGCVRGDADGCHWVGWVIHKGHTGAGKADGKRAIYYYTKACDMKQAASCIDLGHLYKNGADNVDKDPDEAARWYDKGCSMGHQQGCVALGDMHFRGEGVPADPLKAAAAYGRACRLGAGGKCHWIDELVKKGRGNDTQKGNALADLEAGCTERKVDAACEALGNLYAWSGYLTGKDGDRAFALFDAGCKRGVKTSCVQLGHMYANGIGVVKDPAMAKKLFTEQCNGSIAAACTWLGMQLFEEKKFEDAAPLFRRACDDKEMAACNMIGFLHYYALGVSWEVGETKKAYERGCELGNPTACSNLAEMYELGVGTPKDLEKAAALYQKGCTPTSASGCTGLGRFYRDGIVVGRDLDRAETELTRSCDDEKWGQACLLLAQLLEQRGTDNASKVAALKEKARNLIEKTAKENPYGTYLLGLIYRDGVAVVADPPRATELLSTACESYEPMACLEAGLMLLGDRGVPADLPRAAVQLDRACAAGLAQACDQASAARARQASGDSDKRSPGTVNKRSSCACDGDGAPAPATLLLVLVAAAATLRRRA